MGGGLRGQCREGSALTKPLVPVHDTHVSVHATYVCASTRHTYQPNAANEPRMTRMRKSRVCRFHHLDAASAERVVGAGVAAGGACAVDAVARRAHESLPPSTTTNAPKRAGVGIRNGKAEDSQSTLDNSHHINECACMHAACVCLFVPHLRLSVGQAVQPEAGLGDGDANAANEPDAAGQALLRPGLGRQRVRARRAAQAHRLQRQRAHERTAAVRQSK